MKCLDTPANSTRARYQINFLILPHILIKILTLPQIRIDYMRKVTTFLCNRISKKKVLKFYFKKLYPKSLLTHLYKEKDLRKEYTLYADVESCRSTTSVSRDFHVASDQHPRPLRHHRPSPSWRINSHPHKPLLHQNPSEEREQRKNLISKINLVFYCINFNFKKSIPQIIYLLYIFIFYQ